MSVVMDRPPVIEAEPMEDPPETAPRRKRVWGRLLFPWLKTAIASPIEDDDLLIVNSTDDTWALSLGYHDLGSMPPRDRQVVSVVRKGRLQARQVGAARDAPALTLALTPSVRAVEISVTVLQGVALYHLGATERPPVSRRGEQPATR